MAYQVLLFSHYGSAGSGGALVPALRKDSVDYLASQYSPCLEPSLCDSHTQSEDEPLSHSRGGDPSTLAGYNVENPVQYGATQVTTWTVSLQVLYVLLSLYTSHTCVTISYATIIGNILQKNHQSIVQERMAIFIVFVLLMGSELKHFPSQVSQLLEKLVMTVALTAATDDGSP